MNERSTVWGYWKITLVLLAVCVWTSAAVIGYTSPEATDVGTAQCAGPLRADLTGSAVNKKTAAGTGMYKEKGKNNLSVKLRSVGVAPDTSLDVLVGDASVCTIPLPRGRNVI